MTRYVPPLEFGNRAFYGHRGEAGAVVVIDPPREFDRSDVPIDPTRDVLVRAAFLASPVGAQRLRRAPLPRYRRRSRAQRGRDRRAVARGQIPRAGCRRQRL